MTEKKEHFIEDVVGMHELFDRTRNGWVVVERLEHDGQVSFQDNIPPPAQSGNYPPPYPPQQFTRYQIGRLVSFRIRRAEGDIIAMLTQALDGANRQLADMSEQLKRDAQVLTAEKADHEQTKERLKARVHEEGTVRHENTVLSIANRKLEADLGKIREHIGKKLFEEIIPPVAKKV